MGGTLKRLSTLKKLKHFGGLKRPGKLVHLLRVGWRNFFPVVLLCQFWFWQEIGFVFLQVAVES
jgi:hypothetical protein